MKQKHRLQNIALSLASIAFCIVAIHLALWLIDPIGIYEFEYDGWQRRGAFSPHETGYSFEPGTYHFAQHTVTMLEDGLRLVPDSHASNCTIAFVGDSVTFGEGVNDSDTFANLAAKAYGIRVLNVGRSGYNASQVLAQIDYYQADAYIWLSVGNDNVVPLNYSEAMNRTKPSHAPNASFVYFRFFRGDFTVFTETYPTDDIAFNEAIAEIFARSNVLEFAYDDSFSDVPFIRIEDYGNNRLSSFDPHPNGVGHKILFEGMNPYIADFLSDTCP